MVAWWLLQPILQVREILRVNLGIARDVPILRVKRAHTGIVHAVESARK